MAWKTVDKYEKSGDWRKCKVVKLADGVGSRWQALSNQRGKEAETRKESKQGSSNQEAPCKKARKRQLEQGRGS